MTNEMKNMPELRFPEFEGNWLSYALKDVKDPKDKYSFTGGPFGSDLKKSDYKDNGIRIIQLQNINDGNFNDNYKIYTSSEKADILKSCNIYPGDIVIAKMADPLARATILPQNKENRYLMDSDAIRLKVDDKSFNKIFMVNYINSRRFRRQAEDNSSGSTRMRIGLVTLGQLKISSPNKKEQDIIGDFFSKLDRQIELEEQKLAKLEEQKKGYMQKIFSQELRFKDGNGNNYSEWIKTNLKFLVSYKNGKGYEKEVVQNGKYNIINLNSISTKGMLKDSGKYSDFEDITLKKNDLIMILSDVAKGNLIGKTAIIDQDDKYLLNQRVASLRIKDESISNVLFIYYFINYFRQYFINMSTGMSQLNINKSTVEDFLIYLPYIEEQDKIGNFFSNLDKSIIKQLDKIELLKERKKGFLQKMFV